MERVDCTDTELHNWDEIKQEKQQNKITQISRIIITQEQEEQELGSRQEHEAYLEAEQEYQNIITRQETQDSNSRVEQEDLAKAAHEITNLKCCGQEILDQLEQDCESLIGSDVKALYPSIQSESTGKIIRTSWG